MSEAPLHGVGAWCTTPQGSRDEYFIADQPAPAPHRARPEGCAALRIVLVTVLRANRSCELFPNGFDLNLLPEGSRETDALSTPDLA